MKVYNHDVANLVRRMRRFKEEMIKSVSSGVSELISHDYERLNSYLEAIKFFKAWMIAQPVLDLPESSPEEIELGEMPEALLVDNDDLTLIIKLFELIEFELVNSQSARRSTGLVSHDALRFDSYIEKVELFLTDFVDQTSPLDLPESAPSIAMTGAGRTGV